MSELNCKNCGWPESLHPSFVPASGNPYCSCCGHDIALHFRGQCNVEGGCKYSCRYNEWSQLPPLTDEALEDAATQCDGKAFVEHNACNPNTAIYWHALATKLRGMKGQA